MDFREVHEADVSDKGDDYCVHETVNVANQIECVREVLMNL